MTPQNDPTQSLAATPVTKVLFIDGRVPDLQAIIAAAEAGVKVVVLDPDQDGVQQMAKALAGLHDLESISVVSHGDEGVLLLGNGPLFNGNLQEHGADLQAIGAALGPNGDLLLYGCDVGAGDAGGQFLAGLAALTGADVAASNDSSGGVSRGGDWMLEVTTGTIDGQPVLDAHGLEEYGFVLHTTSVSTRAQLQAAIATGNTDGLADFITLTGNITFATAADGIVINVTDGQLMTIVGGGFTLSGNNLARVVDVVAGNVAIGNLTITNGFLTGNGGNIGSGTAGFAGADALGAGVRNAGTLTITNSTITGNKAAGGGGGASQVGGGGGAGGGGGGFGSTFGGTGGLNPPGTPGPASAGVGGNGAGFTASPAQFLGGKGGSTTGGTGGTYGGYTSGGNGATANNGSISIGGGGGGAGYDRGGGKGGDAAGGIYNSGTLTITNSSVTNNIGAGGGGGGGAAAPSANNGNGGNGGSGVGGIWAAGGTVLLDASTNATLATGNAGGAGAGGQATKGGSSSGTAGTATGAISTAGGGTAGVTPTLTAATYDAATGVLVATAAGMTTGDTIAVSSLTLTGQGGATYTLTTANTTATSATAFSVTLNAADKLAVNGLLNANGASAVSGTTFNLAGAANWDASRPTAADPAGNGVTVSNVAAPTITSATYNAATNVLTVTGTNLVKTVGATNDVTVSTLTITGEGGATRTLSTTGNVEVTSATSFSVTLAGADVAAVQALMTGNGTSSLGGTVYNLAAADDWNSVITGGNTADGTNAITVSNAPAGLVSATYDATTGILSVTGANMTTGDTINVAALTLTGQGGATYTLTTANTTATSATAFSVTLNAADKLAVNGLLNNNGATAVSGTTFNLAGAANWDVTASAPADLTGNGVTVSNVTAPTITSATYNAATNVLTVTGTNLVKTVGATNDVTVSTLTITGEGGATRTLSTTGNVEVTSATSFSVTLAGADVAAVQALMTANGTSSLGGTTYNLAAADDWNSVITGGSIADATNAITVSNLPTILVSATYDANTGVLNVAGANMTAGDTINVAALTLTGQGGATYTLTTANTTATSATAFSVTLNAADKLAVNGLLNNNGATAVSGTTFNLAGAANWDVTASAPADLTGNGVTVSNVTAPTITSATYNAATNVLTVTGTNLVKTVGATNDVTVSTLTITGEGGATRTLSTTGNVEVTSATSFSVTLAGADVAAVQALMTGNGTSSLGGTVYNLAAADDWNSVITGGNTADGTNAITVSNAPAGLVSATYDATTGILSVTGANMTTGDTINVAALTLTGQGGGTYTLTTANTTATSATAFSVTLNAADKLAVNGLLNNNGATAVSGTTFNLAGAANWDVTASAPADLTGNGVTVSNVTAPTITSATFDAATNVLAVTGTNLVRTVGATNDITVSTLTITGEGSGTRVLSTTGNVEVTSATSFSVTLAGADIAAVQALMTANGTSSLGGTTYNLAAADDWNSVITGGSIADATNAITVSNAPPGLASATYDATTGILNVTGANMVTGDTIAVSLLTLTGQGGATYTLTTANTTATSATAFSVTLNAADKLAVNGLLNNNGTTAVSGATFNLAGAANWDASRATAADLIGNGVTVSNVTAPTITSATFDASTNVLTVTGTNLVKTVGATNDVTVSTLTITGEGGATRTLTTTGNVEVTSATSFSVTLTGADIAAVQALMTGNGTSSLGGTVYNLAAADDWNSVITGGNTQDLTSNAVTVSNARPTILSATYDAATGILSVTGGNMTAGDTIAVNLLTLTGQGGSYTLTTANTTATNATSFSVTLNAADRLAINGVLNNNGTAAVDTTTFNLAAATNWNATATSPADLTGNGVTVSNVTAPTITSATFNAATNVLTVTGANLVKTVGATNDITVAALTVTGEGAVTRTLSTTGNVEVISATSFTVTLAGADIAAVQALMTGNGTSSLGGTTYNLAAADDWNSVVTGGNIADATNAITVSNAPPRILSATYDASTGILSVTGANMTTGDTIAVNTLSLTGQGGSYTLTTANTTATSATAFSVTLNAADKLAVNGILNNNGSTAVDTTTFNLAAAANWDATATSPADLTGNAVTVSNVTAPTITSATFNAATNVLTVTGTNLVKTVGATNDVTVAALTITGEGGATRALSTTGNVEVVSDTSFTVTLAGADIAAVQALMTGNGTSSLGGAIYNLAAADDWNSVVTGGNIQDLTGNAITVTNARPAIVSATYDAATGILSVTGGNMVTGDTIAVNLLTLTGQGGAPYTLTTANTTASSATTFSVTLNAADKLAVNGLLNNNGTSAVSGTPFNLAAAANWDVTATSTADLTGNAVTVSNVTAPTITNATYDAVTHVLTVTGINLVKATGPTNDITVPNLTLSGEGGATRTLTTTGNVEVIDATSFAVTLTGADIVAVAALFNKNGTNSTGGSFYNLAASDDWNTVITGGNISDLFGNVVFVSNVPVPTITSATYDAAAGVLVVTGTGFSSLSGPANDIDTSKLTLSGEAGGPPLTLSGGGVEITSDTSFSVTLNPADKAAASLFLNKNGTSSTGGATYNLAAAEDWAAGADAAVVVADLAGNGITVSNVPLPTVTSATYDVLSGNLVVTGTGLTRLNGVNNDIDATRLTITGEGGTTYVLTGTGVDITSDTSFTLSVGVADRLALAQILNKNGSSSTGGTTYNLAAADDWAAGADAAQFIADVFANGITVSNVQPPTITSATYDAATGVLFVSGNNFTAFGGATNDIDVSKLTLTGEGGGTRALTSGSVEITGGNSFTVTLNAADRSAVNLLVNKNGAASTSGTTYNLAAAEDWAAGADAAVVVADVTNPVTASNVAAPSITSATYDAATGVLVVTGAGFLSLAGAANDIVANKFTLTGDGGATYSLTDTADVDVTSDTSFTLTLSTADRSAVVALANSNGASSTGGTVYNLAAAEDWTAGADAAVVVADLTGNAVTVSNVAVPTITSATYDLLTGALTLTGTGLLPRAGAANDIVANLLRLTGQGGANYTLTDTPNVEITSGTSVVLTLSATDRAAVALLLNKDGTSSIDATTYNIAGLEDWANGANVAVAVADLTGNAVTVTGNDIVAPVLASATVNGATLVLTYTDVNNLDAANAAAPGAFSVVTGGSPNAVTVVVVNAAAKTVTLTLTTPATHLQTVTVAYTDPTAGNDANATQDIAGNDALTFAATAVTNNTPDTTAPAFSSATVNGNTLVLTYTDASNLDAVNGPATSAFTVVSGGGSNAVTGVAVNAAARTVTLALAATVSYADTVTVAYLDPTAGNDANAIQDAAGNDAATLATTGASNITPPPPAQPGNTPGSGAGIAIVGGAAGAQPQQGDTLAAVTQSLVDPQGVGATLGYQWLRDGAAIAGATGATYVLGAADVNTHVSLAVSYTDGRGNAERVLSPATIPVADNDGVSTAVESLVPTLLAGGQQGDGNGDGIQDSRQTSVVSASLSTAANPPASSFITLVADSAHGLIDGTDANQAVISGFTVSGNPAGLPSGLQLGGLLQFSASVGANGTQETFSVFVDQSTHANGYWLQDAAGHWTNVAAGVEAVGGKIRVDFSITDGGQFDLDGLANGVIVSSGGAASTPLGLIGLPPDLPGGSGFWF